VLKKVVLTLPVLILQMFDAMNMMGTVILDTLLPLIWHVDAYLQRKSKV